MTMQRYRITVGNTTSDSPGFTNKQIQCAIDHVHLLGGGEVELSAGVFHLADSMHLRGSVRVVGQDEKTILRKNAMKGAQVNCFLGYGHYDLSVDNPDAFEIGDGIWMGDDNAGGFYTTVATLVRREGDLWYVNRPHPHDYLERSHGVVYTLFPPVSAYDADDAVIEHLTIDGNKAENPVMLNGCRGGGVFALRCKRLKVLNLHIRDTNTEGISFQTCESPEIAHCLVENCLGTGYHPGSGSTGFHIHHCAARRNAGCGLFYCLRVQHSLLEHCAFEHNGAHGVSTGARDTDSLNRFLTISGNGGCGFYFRDDSRINAAHDTVIEDCTIGGNCLDDNAENEAEVLVQGGAGGVRLRRNAITRRPDMPGILLGPDLTNFAMEGNAITPDGEGAIVDRRATAEVK
jgi:hypothetical protein